jgi:hypothetical protein
LQDGDHFFGNVDYKGDDLLKIFAGTIATFVLDPSRRPLSTSGKFVSNPFVELFGKIVGFTEIILIIGC